MRRVGVLSFCAAAFLGAYLTGHHEPTVQLDIGPTEFRHDWMILDDHGRITIDGDTSSALRAWCDIMRAQRTPCL